MKSFSIDVKSDGQVIFSAQSKGAIPLFQLAPCLLVRFQTSATPAGIFPLVHFNVHC